jgi:hypothetical protein
MVLVDKSLLSFRLDGLFGETRKVILVVIVIIRSLALLFLFASLPLFCFAFKGKTCLDLTGSFLLFGGLGGLLWFVFFVEFAHQVLDCSFIQIGQFLIAF